VCEEKSKKKTFSFFAPVLFESKACTFDSGFVMKLVEMR
jgi:hypothetical protein